MRRRNVAAVMAPVMALALTASMAAAQDDEATELSPLDRVAASAVLERMESSLGASLQPILEAIAAAGDDPEALQAAYRDMAFWALSYARGLELVNFPDGVKPYIDEIVRTHTQFGAAADALAADPLNATLREAYATAEQDRWIAIDALHVAVGLPVPGATPDETDTSAPPSLEPDASPLPD